MTFSDIAAELGIPETTVRRVIDRAIGKVRAGTDEHEIDPESFLTYFLLPRRFSVIGCQCDHVVPRAALIQPLSLLELPVDERAGLPSRFRKT